MWTKYVRNMYALLPMKTVLLHHLEKSPREINVEGARVSYRSCSKHKCLSSIFACHETGVMFERDCRDVIEARKQADN